MTLAIFVAAFFYAVGSAINAVEDFDPDGLGEAIAVALFGIVWAPLFVVWSIYAGSVGLIFGHRGALLSDKRTVW